MNRERRKELEAIVSELDSLLDRLSDVRDEERWAFDNLSEGLQQSERGMKIEENADNLDFACDEINSTIDELREIFGNN